MKRALEYNGKTFDSIIGFAREYGLSYSTVLRKLKNGMSPEEIINKPIKAKPVEYNGISYDSITDFVNAFGLKYTTVQARLGRGWSVDEIVNLKREGKKPIAKTIADKEKTKNTSSVNSKEIEYDGKTFNSIGKFVKHYGLKYSSTIVQLRSGLSPKEVVDRQQQKQIRSGEDIEVDAPFAYIKSINKLKKNIVSPHLMFYREKLVKAEEISTKYEFNIAKQVQERLKELPVKLSFYELDGYTVFHFEDKIPVAKLECNVWIVMGTFKTEFVITDLVPVSRVDSTTINEWNAKYSVAKFWLSPSQDDIYIGSSIPRTTRKDFDILYIMETLYILLGTCEDLSKSFRNLTLPTAKAGGSVKHICLKNLKS